MRHDYLVTVCEHCRRASCWHGEFGCEQYGAAGIIDVPASQLRKERREHPHRYSRKKILEVCGQISELPDHVDSDDGSIPRRDSNARPH